MLVYKDQSATEKSTFYQCPIHISPVSNATKPTQDISDDVARIAAASIALQGRLGRYVRKQNLDTVPVLSIRVVTAPLI